MGGLNEDVSTTNVWKFDGTVWTMAEPLPEPRDGTGLATYGNQLYAVAGSFMNYPDYYSATNVYLYPSSS